MTELRWDEIDKRAVDTARVLAADAVEKVGNGHPGTAMSLAPAAYLLYQRVMKHDPADTHWPGRDRFILSCGHSSLTQYIQLYLGGFGLELDDLKALRTWGSLTPGHPEYGHTKGVEITTGPLGQFAFFVSCFMTRYVCFISVATCQRNLWSQRCFSFVFESWLDEQQERVIRCSKTRSTMSW